MTVVFLTMAITCVIAAESTMSGKCRGAPFRGRSGSSRSGSRGLEEKLERNTAALEHTQEMLARFLQLSDSMPQLVWMADERGVVDYYNLRAQEYAGVEELADGTWSRQQMLHPDDREPTLAAWRAAASTGTPYSAEHRIRMRDGSYRWHLSRALPRPSRDGALRWYGTATDIHALKTAEEAASAAVEHFRLVNRATNDVVWNWDLVTNRLEWNEAAHAHFGSTPPEPGPTIDEWAERIHPSDRDRVVTSIYGTLASDAESWTEEYRFRRNDGTYRVFLDRGYIARDPNGSARRMIGSMLDVTKIRAAEDALRETDRRKDQLIAMLAHELRNPLAPIRNAIDILRVADIRDEAAVRARDVIERQATHMAHLIDDLLDASRVGRGKIELHTEPCDLGQIVRQTVEDYQPSLTSKGIDVSLDIQAEPVWVVGDRTRLAQALGNLLHNAGKYTDAGGRVTVRLTREGNKATVSVADTGIGIAAELVPRLFSPFSQAEQGLDRSRGGLGLGLVLVKGLIELHGGTVDVQSQGEGKGTTFTFRLDTCAPGPVCTQPDRAASPIPAKKILVVEDNQDAADTLKLLLSIEGFDVDIAYDGRSGVAAGRKRPPEIVLCDIGLPGGMDGYAVARTLRQEPATRRAVLIALSGYGQADDRRRSLDAGFDAHVTKPVDIESLKTAIAAVPARDAGP